MWAVLIACCRLILLLNSHHSRLSLGVKRMVCIKRDDAWHLISCLHSSGDSLMVCSLFYMPFWQEQITCWTSLAT